MKQSLCRSAVRLAWILLITAGLASPVFAQSPITIVSPHAGEQIGTASAVGSIVSQYWIRWTAAQIPGNAQFFVYYIDDAGEQQGVCLEPATAKSEYACLWQEASRSVHTLFVQARNASGTPLVTVQSAPFDVVDNMPSQDGGPAWASTDIGDVGRSGGAWGTDDGRFTVRGAGSDIWGTADAFHFAFREVFGQGDVDARATIVGVDGTEPWTKVGVMLRPYLTPGAPHHFVLASRGKGVAYQRRLAPNGPTLHTGLSSSALPVTVEIMRRSGYIVINVRQGGVWRQVAGFTLDEWLLIGLAVSSHDRAVLATGTFADVSVKIVSGTGSTNDNPKVSILSEEITTSGSIPAGMPYTITWTHAQPVNRSTVSYSLDNGQTWQVVPGCASIAANSCVWANPGPQTETARVRVVVEDPNDRAAWTVTYPFAIRADEHGALPAGWANRDVGNVGAPGAATYNATTGQFTVDGSGADIWGTADAFHFVSTTMPRSPNDYFELTARVTSVQNVNHWTKAGLMIRSHTGAAAAHVSFFATPTASKGIAFQRRPTDGALSVHTAGPPLTAPVWLKLVFTGMVHAYYRQQATDPWTYLGSEARQAGSTMEVGLAVSSHVRGTLARAMFDEVSIRPLDAVMDADIGSTNVPGGADGDFVNTAVHGSGPDIWGVADAFHYRFKQVGSSAVVSAGVRSVEPTHPWAKAGVMIRETLSPGSRHVMLIVSPGKGIAMQYRGTRNGTSANVALVPGTAPQWLRLVRNGSLIVGEASDNGTAWREIGRINLALEEVVTGGLAVTSHDNTTLATAQFTDIIIQP